MGRSRLVAAACLSLVIVAPRFVVAQDDQGRPSAPAPRSANTHALGGAAIGAAALIAVPVVNLKACRVGCEASFGSTAGMVLLAGLVGAGVGGTLGHLADRSAAGGYGRGQDSFFPDRPSVQIGAVVGQMSFRSPRLEGSASGPGVSIGFDVSPYISARIEYMTASGTFSAAPGTVSENVLANVVPADSRRAGR